MGIENNELAERLRKLLELARRGVDGEKVTAQEMLDKLLKKYDITLESLDEPVREWRRIDLGLYNYWYQEIVKRCAMMTIPTTTYKSNANNSWGRPVKPHQVKYFAFECTLGEWISFREHLDFYWKKFNEDMTIFYEAFVHRNEMYALDAYDRKDRPPLTAEELERLMKIKDMMKGMHKHHMPKAKIERASEQRRLENAKS